MTDIRPFRAVRPAAGLESRVAALPYDVYSRREAAQEAAKAGLLCCDMHQAAEKVISDAGYGQYFTHALGHSVGLEIHEAPVASLRCERPLQDGIVITDEPLPRTASGKIQRWDLQQKVGCKR